MLKIKNLIINTNQISYINVNSSYIYFGTEKIVLSEEDIKEVIKYIEENQTIKIIEDKEVIINDSPKKQSRKSKKV